MYPLSNLLNVPINIFLYNLQTTSTEEEARSRCRWTRIDPNPQVAQWSNMALPRGNQLYLYCEDQVHVDLMVSRPPQMKKKTFETNQTSSGDLSDDCENEVETSEDYLPTPPPIQKTRPTVITPLVFQKCPRSRGRLPRKRGGPPQFNKKSSDPSTATLKSRAVRGRKRKSTNETDNENGIMTPANKASRITVDHTPLSDTPKEPSVKRGRGRPKGSLNKNPKQTKKQAKLTVAQFEQELQMASASANQQQIVPGTSKMNIESDLATRNEDQNDVQIVSIPNNNISLNNANLSNTSFSNSKICVSELKKDLCNSTSWQCHKCKIKVCDMCSEDAEEGSKRHCQNCGIRSYQGDKAIYCNLCHTNEDW